MLRQMFRPLLALMGLTATMPKRQMFQATPITRPTPRRWKKRPITTRLVVRRGMSPLLPPQQGHRSTKFSSPIPGRWAAPTGRWVNA